ncbi:MAG: hypothetical protein IJJ26_06515 [Victivallales bacterium]|nr:hypothetical protein [Victivallales bacterium]
MPKPAKPKQAAPSLIWAEPEQGRAILARLQASPQAAVANLVPRLNRRNDSATVLASFALDGLVMEALAPGHEKEARTLALAIVQMLPQAADEVAVCILLKYLQLLAVPETIPAIAPFLKEEPTLTNALAALEAMASKDDTAGDVLQGAVLASRGHLRIRLLAELLLHHHPEDSFLQQALSLLPHVTGDEQRLLWRALAHATPDNPVLLDDLLNHLDNPSRLTAGFAEDFLSQCIEYTDFWQEPHLRKTAQRWWKKTHSPRAFHAYANILLDQDQLFAFCQKEFPCKNAPLRSVILQTLADTPIPSSQPWTERIVAWANTLQGQDKADLVRVLGKRQDSVSRPFLLASLQAPEVPVRHAAFQALQAFPAENLTTSRLASLIIT